MPIVDVSVSSVLSQSMRCRQVESLFDVPPEEKQTLRWTGEVPLEERPWNVGLIIGPSGCGKSTVARSLFGDALNSSPKWGAPSVIDDFPADTSIEEIAAICQAVGFNTIPAWLRPHRVLSNGEQFRVMLARLLIESPELVVLDEFTSVVDRQVARIGSHAVQKYVRKRGTQFVGISCHHDIVEWLNPDWTLEPATMQFAWRELQRRPQIEVEIARVDYSCWRLFAPYHYMTAELNKAAQCFALFIGGQPAAFGAMLHRPVSRGNAQPVWGLSRLVTLPDYQGLGLAFVLTDALGAAFKACGQRMHTYPAHPALIRSFDRAASWRLERKPGLIAKNKNKNKLDYPDSSVLAGSFGGRPNAVFSYAGPAAPDPIASRQFLGIPSLSRTT
jgi:ABC-type lipoprotein export system ATPase subunit